SYESLADKLQLSASGSYVS
ncbi:hypothetical protein A2U01_0061103, partial [Trifolium medium]|nr:hypothetical protein [Trifolium medium]